MAENSLSIMDLRDIVVPVPAGFWPPAPFVWILLGAAGVGLAIWIWRSANHWKTGAYRRAALDRLSQIEAKYMIAGEEAALLHQLSVLLKRVALAAFPRNRVAPLHGEEWVRFLDLTCERCSFSSGSGRLLSAAAVTEKEAPPTGPDDYRQLLDLTRKWIQHHRRPNAYNPDMT